VQSREASPVLEKSEQTRLGRGFYESRRLQPEAIANTARAVADFASLATDLQAQSIRVVATSAARDAANAEELVQAVRQKAGLVVEIISGEQEAEWAFRGVTSDPAMAGKPLLILDVGGGSTEFILGEAGRASYRQSFPLGTVRSMERLLLPDPPGTRDLANCRATAREFIERQILPMLGPAVQQCATKPCLIGTGGTATILGRIEKQLADFDRKRIEGARLNREQIKAWVERLWSLPLAERKQVVGLPPNRADVILFGVVIY